MDQKIYKALFETDYSYKDYAAYIEAPAKIKKEFDNLYLQLRTLLKQRRQAETEEDKSEAIKAVQKLYAKVRRQIIYTSEKYSGAYCRLLQDANYYADYGRAI